MENSYSSYAESGDSSPRSREIDSEHHSWDELPANYKVKFMCSYGGKIQPRPHDNQLAYVGGETKIIAVDRNTKFSTVNNKLSSICDYEISLKYQLPGEDLDALVSVTNDEDLDHMMIEYDRLYRASAKPARLRLFLFPMKSSNPSSFTGKDPKSNQQWFVDALNSAQIQQSLDATSPPASDTPSNPDFLFGLENTNNNNKGITPASPVAKLQDPLPESTIHEPIQTPDQVQVGSDFGREEPIVSQAEIQRQIHELQRMQIANQEQTMYQRNSDENLNRGFHGDYYVQKFPESTVQAGNQVPVQQPPVSVPQSYWQERHITAPPAATGADHPVYLIPTPSGYYQAPTTVRQVATGQGYYAMPRDVYREQPVYGVPPPQQAAQSQQQAQQRMVAGYGEGVGMVRQPPPPQTGGGMTMAMADGTYAQVGYDSAGRQVYYTTAAPGGVIQPPQPSYATVTAGGMDLRQQQMGAVGGGGALAVNQEGGGGGKIPNQIQKPSPQTSV